MDTTVLQLRKRGGQFLTLKKSNLKKHYKHIKFLGKSKYPELPAFITAHTSR